MTPASHIFIRLCPHFWHRTPSSLLIPTLRGYENRLCRVWRATAWDACDLRQPGVHAEICQDHPKPKGAKNPVQHCHPPPEIVLAVLRIPINLTVYPKLLCGHKDNPDPKRIQEDSTQIAHSTESLSWTSCPAFPLLVALDCTSMPFALPLEKLDLSSSRVGSDRASQV